MVRGDRNTLWFPEGLRMAIAKRPWRRGDSDQTVCPFDSILDGVVWQFYSFSSPESVRSLRCALFLLLQRVINRLLRRLRSNASEAVNALALRPLQCVQTPSGIVAAKSHLLSALIYAPSMHPGPFSPQGKPLLDMTSDPWAALTWDSVFREYNFMASAGHFMTALAE